MSQTQSSVWIRRLGLLGLINVLRTWLPSIIAHVLLLVALTFITVSVTALGDEGDDEMGVHVVMREQREQQQQPTYVDQQQFESKQVHTQQHEEQQSEQLEISDMEELKQELGESESLIGVQAHDAGGAALGGGGGGGGGQVSFFGLQGKGKRVIFIIDRSGSMNGEPFQSAKEEIYRSINNLPRGARYGICFFSNGPSWLSVEGDFMVRSSRGRNKQVFNWMKTVDVGGGTYPASSLLSAIDLKPDVIFFLTDGEFPLGVVEEVTKHNKGRVQIHCIAFGVGGRNLLRAIAAKNKGTFAIVNRKQRSQR